MSVTFDLILLALCTCLSQTDPREFFIHPCPLGSNLYNKDRMKVVPPVRKGDLITGPVKREDEYTTAVGG